MMKEAKCLIQVTNVRYKLCI